MVKLETTKDRRRLHIGSFFVDLNETDYQDLINIFGRIAKNISSNPPVISSVPDPITDFAGRIARALKDSRSSTVVFYMQQAYPDDVNGLDQPSIDDILDNIITLTTIREH